MTQTLTPGRWRALRRLGHTGGVFTIMAFDQRGAYLGLMPEGTPYQTLVDIKREVAVALAPHTSAVLLDAEYGLPAMLCVQADRGLLVALEKSGYSGDSTHRRIAFDTGWTVAKIKRIGADAVKLLAYYHPDSGALAEEIKAVIAQVASECHKHDLPLFLEPVSYSLDAGVKKESAAFAATRAQVVAETARRLTRSGADVLKLEFPVDAAFDTDLNSWRAACDAISSVCDVPWVLLSAGVDFETFERQTRVACEAGASGFLAGRAIWKECVTMPPEERAQFLSSTGPERLNRITEIAEKNGRPWTDFYTPPEPKQGWYTAY